MSKLKQSMTLEYHTMLNEVFDQHKLLIHKHYNHQF